MSDLPDNIKLMDEGDFVRAIPDGVSTHTILCVEDGSWHMFNVTCEVTEKAVSIQRWDKTDPIQTMLLPDKFYVLDTQS